MHPVGVLTLQKDNIGDLWTVHLHKKGIGTDRYFHPNLKITQALSHLKGAGPRFPVKGRFADHFVCRNRKVSSHFSGALES